MTGSSPARNVLIPLAFVNFTIGAGAFLPIALLAPLSKALSLTKAQAGWVMGVYAISYALSSPVLIALSGKIRRRTIILAGIGLFIAASLASALATGAATLYVARVLAAIGAGLVTPVAAVHERRTRRRGPGIGFDRGPGSPLGGRETPLLARPRLRADEQPASSRTSEPVLQGCRLAASPYIS